jgi:DNA-binding NtrC family response regulator
MKINNIKRTFIVDDDPFWTTMLTQMLADLGYTNVVSFKDGKGCIDHLHFNPNLVFLDYEMDILNGIDVLKKIKEYYPGIGVVFCTAHEDLSVAVDAMQNGSFDFLLKSNTTKNELARIIRNMYEKQIFADKVY